MITILFAHLVTIPLPSPKCIPLRNSFTKGLLIINHPGFAHLKASLSSPLLNHRFCRVCNYKLTMIFSWHVEDLPGSLPVSAIARKESDTKQVSCLSLRLFLGYVTCF